MWAALAQQCSTVSAVIRYISDANPHFPSTRILSFARFCSSPVTTGAGLAFLKRILMVHACHVVSAVSLLVLSALPLYRVYISEFISR